MPWMQGYPYYLLMGSVLSLYMSVKSYRRRSNAGGRYLWILMLLVSVMFISTAGEVIAPTLQAKLWWKNVQQPPLFLSTILTYAVVKEYVSQSSEGLARRLALFCIPVVFYLGLIFTDSYHQLMRSSIGIVTVAGVSGVAVHPEPLSMMLIAYDQLIGLYAVYLLAASLRSSPKPYFWPHLLLLASLSIPVVFSFLLPLLKIEITGFTAFTYFPPMVAAYFLLLRDPRIAIYPTAKNTIFENMKDGILLTDHHDNIIVANEAAEAMLSTLTGGQGNGWMGRNIYSLLEYYGEIAVHYARRMEGQFEIDASGTDEIWYGVSLIATERSVAEDAGMLIVLSDLSEKKRYERELLYQATVDDLTGLYNRRHFMRLVQHHLADNGGGVALLLFDIDDFKLINDTYGHIAGDKALMDFAQKMLNVYCDSGITGRVGGEEFAVFFAAGGEAAALQEAEHFRITMGSHTVRLDGGHQIRLTVSIGVAYTERRDATFEELYRQADDALYISKSTGKNKVTLGRPPVWREALKG
ncbi:histidine kinase N-terminal 7TM domain-containing diguanylate cyclase [Paenibacillus tengchongensis]|uniref:histidine kinase N-terminal 7TM domain-containing diguanylate cyclase n=1 Tax=Paenibacillus tengchongensis TaxID=2608684 RepID=UPI00124C03D3|nr:diguanylate cyclase [Paenibacillus tengchongensis]